MPNEHPILFSGPMVRAIVNGTKTQTRRVITPQPKVSAVGVFVKNNYGKTVFDWRGAECNYPAMIAKCPFGQIGERLWVRETFALETWTREFGDEPPIPPGKPYREYHDGDRGEVWEWPHYRATDPAPELVYEDTDEPTCRWQPSIFMPRWASRLTLEITNVRAERLQDIWEKSHSFDECFREGIPQETAWDGTGTIPTPLSLFINLWNSINAKRGYSWESNPWVWVIEFKKLEGDHATG